MRHIQFILLLCCPFFFVVSSGCSSPARQETPSPAADDALSSAASMLASCVRTGKRGDDLTNYKEIVDAIRPSHRDIATILEAGFEELLTVPESEVKATARRIMAQAQFESDVE